MDDQGRGGNYGFSYAARRWSCSGRSTRPHFELPTEFQVTNTNWGGRDRI